MILYEQSCITILRGTTWIFGPSGERATDGNLIYPNQAEVAYGYDGSGNLIAETLTQYGNVYVKTYTWTGGNLTVETLWVLQ